MRYAPLALLVFAVACPASHTTSAPTSAPAPASVPAAAPRSVPASVAAILPDDAGDAVVANVRNFDRLPELDARQRELLDRHGFFVARQPGPARAKESAAHARTGQAAKHLFQVYERNDYIRFPSYVTVDLAIDLTHQYFDVVLRKVETDHLAPRLRTALQGLVRDAHAHARSAPKQHRPAALAAAAYWATALRLLEQPANGDAPDGVVARSPFPEGVDTEPGPKSAAPAMPSTKIPRELEPMVRDAVARVHAHRGLEKFAEWGLELDTTQMKPRSHYNGSGVLQRYFRAMSFLGMTSFPIDGERARPELLVALVRGHAGAADRKAFDDVLRVTSFVVGEPPTAGFARAADMLEGAVPGAAKKPLAELLGRESLAAAKKAWSGLPRHPIADDGPVVQPIGQRVFVDTLAMSALLPLMRDQGEDRGPFVARAMGAAGAAAVLGSETAASIVLERAGASESATRSAIERGRAAIGRLEQKDDAYHRTLVALKSMLGADSLWFDAHAHELRMLQSFAGGWAMLRHDTLLYAYQMGAECDAEEHPAPHGWVEPVPRTYAGLREMVKGFAARLHEAGIADPPRKDEEEFGQFSTLQQKTDALVGFLDRLEALANKELAGQPFTPEERTEIAMAGGFAEHVLLTFADAFELGEGNDDMAIIADVFTWRGNALEVGVGHPELVYAVIPTPDGWMLARGAVLAYREFFVPIADRMTDEAWRARLARSKDFEAASRPDWLAPISAEPVPVVVLPKNLEAQTRCEYFGGAFEL
jgi:hypothetical protein